MKKNTPELHCDLLLKGGYVIDPANGRNQVLDVAVKEGRILAVEPDICAGSSAQILDMNGLYVVPGLIDMHCHIYPQFPYPREDSLRTVNAQEQMFRCGVTTAVDAGTCGCRNIGDFKEHVADRTKLRVLAFLNIADRGMAYTDSEQAAEEFHPKLAAAEAEAFPDLIVGIKSAHYWPKPFDKAHPAWASIDSGKEASVLSGLPLMADSIPILPERSYSAILSRLTPGDIHTHVYAQQFPLLDKEGNLREELLRHRERGILFDTGHGSGSFWFRQAVPCLRQGFSPDSISTDLHHQNVTGPAIDLLYVMSKFAAMGMPLYDVIEKTTVRPASILNRKELGTLSEGACADIAVLRKREGRFGFMDCGGARLTGEGRLECVITIREGRLVYDPEARGMPDWESAPPAYFTPPGLLQSWTLWN